MASSSAPTDLELMLFADGELGDERRALVEAWLAEAPDARAKIASLYLVGDALRHASSSAPSSPSGSVADAVMRRLSAEEKPPRARAWKRAALAASGLAAAAAVVLTIARPSTTGSPVAIPQAPSVAMTTPVAEVPAGTREHGVEVWSVDFGSRSGAVFYIPSDGSSETTTVVWLSEKEIEGSEPE